MLLCGHNKWFAGSISPRILNSAPWILISQSFNTAFSFSFNKCIIGVVLNVFSCSSSGCLTLILLERQRATLCRIGHFETGILVNRTQVLCLCGPHIPPSLYNPRNIYLSFICFTIFNFSTSLAWRGHFLHLGDSWQCPIIVPPLFSIKACEIDIVNQSLNQLINHY